MFFRRKRPHRLYIPTSRKWFTRKRPTFKPKTHSSSRWLFTFRKEFFKFLGEHLYIVFGALLVLLFVIFLVFSSHFSIKTIEVARENLSVDAAAIENLLGKYRGKNILIFPRGKMIDDIHAKYPEFSKVEVSKIFPGALRIHLETWPIVANLRAYYVLPKVEPVKQEFDALEKAIEEIKEDKKVNDQAPLPPPAEEALSPLANPEIANSVFSLNSNGSTTKTTGSFTIAEPAPEEIKPVEQKSLLNEIGQAIFDQKENLELITVILRGLTQPIEDRELIFKEGHMEAMLESLDYFKNKMKLEIKDIEYIPTAREFRMKAKNGTVFWINIERDFKAEIDKVAAIYESSGMSKEDIAYIDLRVRDKIIYCPRHSSCDKF